MIDGAKTLIPVETPLCNRNKKDVSVLVFPSNLFSRNSYAVYTLSLLKIGTKKIQITTIARGSPKYTGQNAFHLCMPVPAPKEK